MVILSYRLGGGHYDEIIVILAFRNYLQQPPTLLYRIKLNDEKVGDDIHNINRLWDIVSSLDVAIALSLTCTLVSR